MREARLRGRAALDEGLLARPERPRRWTLPMTALRVMPPSSAAIWLALAELRAGGLPTGARVLALGAEASKYLYGGFAYVHA